MKSSRITPEKRMSSDSRDCRSECHHDESIHQTKQSKGSNSPICSTCSSTFSSSGKSITSTRANVTFGHNLPHHAYRSRSRSSVSFVDNKSNQSDSEYNKLLDQTPTSHISSTLINALQMPQNISQVFPNINLNMSSLPDYLPQLPSVPSISNISIPNLQMPSMPSLSMPSMPNLSMPNITMPSIPNINIPSISDFMNFQLRRNIKSWSQISQAVRDSRKKFNDVCPSLPFNFNFYYPCDDKVRIYFLSSHNSPETTLFYCDVHLVNQSYLELNNSCLYNKSSSAQENMNEIFDTDENLDDKISIENNHQLEMGNGDLESDDYDIGSNSKNSLSSSSSENSFTYTCIDPSLIRKSIASPTSSIANLDALEWKPLVSMNKSTFPKHFSENNSDFSLNQSQSKGSLMGESSKPSSPEEDLLLQRKRMLYNGIVSYDFNSSIPRFVFTFKNILYWFDDLEMLHGKKSCPCSTVNEVTNHYSNQDCTFNVPSPYLPRKLITNKFVKVNATMCPYDPDIVAYVADHDLWVCDLVSCKEMRLTNTEYSKTTVMAGRPSFVMQEEFSRFSGFWWRPVHTETENSDTFYTILCEYVDESCVDSISVSSWDGTSETHRFPKSGCPNAKSSLKLVHFSLNDLKTLQKTNQKSSTILIENVSASFETLFPEYEYLVRCDWHSGDIVWAQLLNRHQNKLVIVFVSVSNRFPPQIIYDEAHKDHWFNCHDILYFYSSPTPNEYLDVGSIVNFLWSSELSGFRHLYKIAIELMPTEAKKEANTNFVNGLNHNDNVSLPFTTDILPLHSKEIYNKQLTSGNWQVSDTNFWVDEKNDLVYFTGTKDSHLESHLYVISPSQPSRLLPRRLSKESFTHTRIILDPLFKFCIDFQSNLSVPPFAYLNQIVSPEDSSQSVNLESSFIFQNIQEDVAMEDSMEYYDKVQYLGPTPQLFEYKLKSGELMYGFVFKPDFMESGVKYPTLLEIYGGPEVQYVTKSFKDLRQHRRHLIASEGYIVVGFDSRGSKNRGVEFERHIYKRLGQVEIQDQVEALQWLAENTGFIDMNRVAIHGWSYGGYLSLMALAQRPDIFKCAIAGAPVTNWFLYDTGYTERYMGLPEENEESYKLSNVFNYIKQFPDEHNRLLIIHGLMDENVHFTHTAQLIHALIMLGKPYSLNVFPYERHSLRKLYCSEHYEATLLYYLQQNL